MDESRIVVELRVIDRGSFKAAADVSLPSHLGEITIRGFRVIDNGTQAAWVGFPSSSYVKNGETIRSPLLQMTAALRRCLVEAILSEYEGHK